MSKSSKPIPVYDHPIIETHCHLDYLKQDSVEAIVNRANSVGVESLITIAVEKGKATRRDLKLGICGEHGGDPQSIRFCEQNSLDDVSCSPFRVPIARLAAAQAALEK